LNQKSNKANRTLKDSDYSLVSDKNLSQKFHI